MAAQAEMRAVVKLAPEPGAIGVRTWPVPEPPPGETLVRVRAAGVCGTDLSLVEWNELATSAYSPPLPVVMGHECYGELVDGSPAWPAGTTVAVNPSVTCGRCRYCRAERSTLCPERRLLGFQRDGCFAEYVAVPHENVVPLPPGLPFAAAALSEPFTVSIHALERLTPRPGDTVAIVGPGSIGLCVLTALQLSPAGRIIAIGTPADRHRLALAAELGALPIDAGDGDPVARVRELTNGDGADVVYETAGHPRAVDLAIRIGAKTARIGLLGLPHEPALVQSAHIVIAEQDVFGIRGYDRATWRRLPALVERAAPHLARLVSLQVPLERGAEAFDLVRAHDGVKVLITP